MILPDQFKKLVEDMSGSGAVRYRYNSPLSQISTFRIGGDADVIVYPKTLSAAKHLIAGAKECGVRYDVFGNCSNVLFDDKGYRGAVILTGDMSSVTVSGNILTAECGASLVSVTLAAEKAGLSGLEFAYGIPGSVGGAVYMNAGAYGGEMSDVVLSTEFVTRDMAVGCLSGADHRFGYRKSAYSEGAGFLLSATFGLIPAEKAVIRSKMDEFMQKRREKQPLEYPSAGSAFKRYPGFYTAKLIDDAGLKGFSVGGAQVSSKHAGFIINKGGATSADVHELVRIIKEKVYEKNGINIECEIISVPEKA